MTTQTQILFWIIVIAIIIAVVRSNPTLRERTSELLTKSYAPNLIALVITAAIPFLSFWGFLAIVHIKKPHVETYTGAYQVVKWLLFIGPCLVLKPLVNFVAIPEGSIGKWWLWGWVVPFSSLSRGPALVVGEILQFPAAIVVSESLLRGPNGTDGIVIQVKVPTVEDVIGGGLISGKASFAIRFKVLQSRIKDLIAQLQLKWGEKIDWEGVHKERIVEKIKALVLEAIRGFMASVSYENVLSRDFAESFRNRIAQLNADIAKFGIELDGLVLTKFDMNEEFAALLQAQAAEGTQREQQTSDIRTTMDVINAALEDGPGGPARGAFDRSEAVLMSMLSRQGADANKIAIAYAIMTGLREVMVAFGASRRNN